MEADGQQQLVEGGLASNQGAPLNLSTQEEGHPLLEAWVAFLSRWSWDLFCSFTFKAENVTPGYKHERLRRTHSCDYVHPEKADKLFRLLISEMNEELYGQRWAVKQARDGVGVRWARCLEFQRRGVLHYHALLAERRIDELRRLSYMDRWGELAGWARIERPDNEYAVARYCSKYVVKAGQIDLGGGELGKGLVVANAFAGGSARAIEERFERTDYALLMEEHGKGIEKRDAELWLYLKGERSRRWDRTVPRRWVWE